VLPTRWRAATNLSWKQYDDSDDWVVYDPASADLHLLTAAAHQLWTLIADEQERTFDQIVAALAEALGRTANPEFVDATRAALVHMDRLGLIHPVWS
jgi:PqqD family protein of HPr-rel-A system